MSRVMVREKSYFGDEVFFCISEEYVRAEAGRDVCIPIPDGAEAGDSRYPSCPDCGGDVVWAEAGRVPGSRDCTSCGSEFADMKYHA